MINVLSGLILFLLLTLIGARLRFDADNLGEEEK